MARTPLLLLLSLGLTAMVTLSGCMSPSHTEDGAVLGGGLGAVTGAIIGGATGHPLAGAAIGAGVGGLSGAAIGNAQDDMEAKNRAMIAQQLGRQVSAAAVTPNDVIAMTRAGVNEELILNHIRSHGAMPLQPADLITLQQQNISPRIIATMQATPPPQTQPVIVEQAAPPPAVIVEGYPYGYYGPRYPHHYYWH